MRKEFKILIPLGLLLLTNFAFAAECPSPFQCIDVPICHKAGGICHGEYDCHGLGCCCEFQGKAEEAGGIGVLIKEAIDFVINIVIICAGIIIIIGGYLMMTSAGNPEKFEKGKKTLLYGAIGFILVFAAKELAEEIIRIVK
jgi:hypothetical protein